MPNAARGTFEELVYGTAPEVAAIARRLRASGVETLRKCHLPEDLGWGVPPDNRLQRTAFCRC